MPFFLPTSLDEVSAIDILERVLEGCIVFDPTTRILLFMTDFTRHDTRVVVAPERRRKAFTIPRHSLPADSPD